MKDWHFMTMLARTVGDGVNGAALVERDGNVVAFAGAVAEEEAMPLAAVVMYRLKSGDLASRLFAGEILSLSLDDRDVAVGVAKRQLFVVAVLEASTPATLARVREVREQVERMLADATSDVVAASPWSGGGGGSGSGPAELPLVEFGITVRGERGKA
jgi:hypothetical protein